MQTIKVIMAVLFTQKCHNGAFVLIEVTALKVVVARH